MGETGTQGIPGNNGTNGTNGAPGAAGRGISGQAVTYQAGSSGTTAPTGTWNTSIPTVTAGQFLWTRTITSYTDNSTPTTSYSVGKMGETGTQGIPGTNGTNGTNGAPGAAGVSVTSAKQQWYRSTSSTSMAGGSWADTPAAYVDGAYYWVRLATTLSSGTTTYSTGVLDATMTATLSTVLLVQDVANQAQADALTAQQQAWSIANNQESVIESKLISERQSNMALYDKLADRKLLIDATTNGIKIGNPQNSIFSMQLSNTELDFMQGGQIVSSFSNDAVNVTNARVARTLSVGDTQGSYVGWFDFIFNTATGNLGVKYRGGA
jgi:hypothetical protein